KDTVRSFSPASVTRTTQGPPGLPGTQTRPSRVPAMPSSGRTASALKAIFIELPISRSLRAVGADIHSIKRRGRGDEEAVPLLAAEGQVAHHFGQLDAAELGPFRAVADDTVLGRG